MIRSIRHKELERFHASGSKAGIPAGHAKKLNLILAVLDSAVEEKDVDLPGLALHPLKGKLKGYSSVWVSGNWRVIFRFEDKDVFEVDYVDYH